jgi:hypothetical protein
MKDAKRANVISDILTLTSALDWEGGRLMRLIVSLVKIG